MRIAYLCHYSPPASSGVGRKVLAQCRAWVDAGHDVTLWALTRSPSWSALSTSFPVHAAIWSHGIQLPTAWLSLLARLLSSRQDVLYIRQMPWLPGLTEVMSRCLSVVEIQTDDLAELCGGSLSHRWHRATRAALLDAAHGFVFMTDELARAPQYRSRGQPRIVLPNPVPDLEPLPPPRPEQAPRLALLASPGYDWHGVDVALQVASSLPEFGFDIIGPTDPPSSLPSNVVWHGWLEPAAYRPVLARASVALGTLALFRKSMRQACPLKVRECLGLGLPVIIGYEDPDLPEGTPWCLRVTVTPDARLTDASLVRVRAFVAQWHGRRVDPRALDPLRSRQREARRLAFLEALYARHRRFTPACAGGAGRRW